VQPQEIVRRLHSSRLFGHLPEELLTSIAKETSLKQYTAGNYLWRAGEEALHFTIIQTGLVEVRRPTPNGEGTMIGLFGPRESVGDFAVLDVGTFPADAIAVSETCDVLRVRSAPVIDTVRSQPRMAHAINMSLVEHSKVLRTKIDVMSAGTVPKRLALFFTHMIDRFGDEGEDGLVHIPVSLSRVQLSRLVGARVETVIRTLSKWQKDGWIETREDGFHLTSTEPLKALVETD